MIKILPDLDYRSYYIISSMCVEQLQYERAEKSILLEEKL